MIIISEVVLYKKPFTNKKKKNGIVKPIHSWFNIELEMTIEQCEVNIIKYNNIFKALIKDIKVEA